MEVKSRPRRDCSYYELHANTKSDSPPPAGVVSFAQPACLHHTFLSRAPARRLQATRVATVLQLQMPVFVHGGKRRWLRCLG
jgi:hypothetical protein